MSIANSPEEVNSIIIGRYMQKLDHVCDAVEKFINAQGDINKETLKRVTLLEEAQEKRNNQFDGSYRTIRIIWIIIASIFLLNAKDMFSFLKLMLEAFNG